MPPILTVSLNIGSFPRAFVFSLIFAYLSRNFLVKVSDLFWIDTVFFSFQSSSFHQVFSCAIQFVLCRSLCIAALMLCTPLVIVFIEMSFGGLEQRKQISNIFSYNFVFFCWYYPDWNNKRAKKNFYRQTKHSSQLNKALFSMWHSIVINFLTNKWIKALFYHEELRALLFCCYIKLVYCGKNSIKTI